MDHYNNIKELLINNEIKKRIKDYSKNRSDLETYLKVGEEIVIAQGGEERAKYGNKLIKEYSARLTRELGKGYGITNLKYMRSFYLYSLKGQTMSDQLTWSHYLELLSLSNIDKINYYISKIECNNLSVRELRQRIKSNEYERLPQKTKEKLIESKETSVVDYVKNPIIIRDTKNHDDISERALQEMILDKIPSFLEELGEGFTFVKNEYRIKIGDTYNSIDLLLYNIKYKCYIVIELKVTELKKEHIGQIEVYMNYIDKHLKTNDENYTEGIILCRKNKGYYIEYTSNKRIIPIEYIIL
ncbi:MAG: DUF1016 family protein [Bacilli bacterium]|nr:DUF1016 family protein [Bacilli bacterium]